MNHNKWNEDVPKMINQYEKKNKLKFYVNTNKNQERRPNDIICLKSNILAYMRRYATLRRCATLKTKVFLRKRLVRNS